MELLQQQSRNPGGSFSPRPPPPSSYLTQPRPTVSCLPPPPSINNQENSPQATLTGYLFSKISSSPCQVDNQNESSLGESLWPSELAKGLIYIFDLWGTAPYVAQTSLKVYVVENDLELMIFCLPSLFLMNEFEKSLWLRGPNRRPLKSGILPLALAVVRSSRPLCLPGCTSRREAAFCKGHPHRELYLALCHQLPKNSENQIYFLHYSLSAPLCRALSLT